MTDTTTEQSKDVLRRLYEEVWNQGALELANELLAEEFVHRGNIVPENTNGPDDYCEFVRDVLRGFPDTTVELVATVGEGDRVASRWVAHGTNTGEYLGIEPTDRLVSTNGVSFATVEEGEIVALWDLYDTDALLRQLDRSTDRGR